MSSITACRWNARPPGRRGDDGKGRRIRPRSGENARERVRRERYDEEANTFLLLYEAGKFIRTHDSKLGGRMTRGEAEQHGRRWMGRKSDRGYVLDAQPGPDVREAEKSHEPGGVNDGGSESTGG